MLNEAQKQMDCCMDVSLDAIDKQIRELKSLQHGMTQLIKEANLLEKILLDIALEVCPRCRNVMSKIILENDPSRKK